MEKLLIVRTNPTQGKPVEVKFEQEGRTLAVGSFPFDLWLQFEKLVKEGLEYRQRQDPRNTRLAVTFEATEVHEQKAKGLRESVKIPEIDPELAEVLEEEEVQKVVNRVTTTLRGE